MRRRSHRPPPPSDHTAALLPTALRDQLLRSLGDEVELVEKALTLPSPTSIRLNPSKPFNLNAEPVPWCSSGRYLAERPSFTLDPLFHAGAYYVQEASSMLLEQALIASGMLEHDVLALDLCAAPGGKSTHLLSLLTGGSCLVANEPDVQRRHVLAENIWKHGAPNAMITGSSPVDLEALPETFDLILVDAPCSGEGMFRKDPFARAQWSPQLVASCAAMQHHILRHAWNALVPGGTLIYSTCTWESAENEEQLIPFIREGGQAVPLALQPEWGVVTTMVSDVIGHRCYPHRVKGEGFFVAVVRKPGAWKPRTHELGNTSLMRSVPWMKTDAGYFLLDQDDAQYAVPAQWASTMSIISGAMRLHVAGAPVAVRKGGHPVPHPAAALSWIFDELAFPVLPLGESEALAYLGGAAIPAKGAAGLATVTYKGLPLGVVHGAGNRWNNRWPAPWRIRTQRSTAPRVSWHGGSN